ncbi:MAG: site-2 protease family protein, partial [Actinomycetota bacterium]|nr:site-2 protease family protein [Actinomycetota bacterium]
LCILAHELGHTLVSGLLGYPVKRVVLFLLGGVSEIDGEPTRARHELLISAAGPLVSVLLAAGAFGGYLAIGAASLPGVLLALLAWSNIILAAFNLLPGLPLDGGRILRAVVWGFGAASATGTRVAAWSGRALAILVAAAGLVLDRGPDGIAAAALTLALAGYLWVSATQSLKIAELMGRLPEVDVSTLLRPGLLVPADLSIAEALRRVWNTNARGLVVLDRAEKPSAIVDERAIGLVPPERRAWVAVSEVARPLEPGLMVPLGTNAKDLLEHMQKTPAREYLVVEPDGSPAGIIATIDFADRLKGPTPVRAAR